MERVNQRNNHLVGTNIKKIRQARKLRCVDVVAKLQLRGVEISSSTYSKIENGRSNPSVDFLAAMTDILRCDYNALFEK